MHRIFFCAFVLFSATSLLSDETSSCEQYLSLMEKYKQHIGNPGNYRDGEIEIALTPAKIKEISSIQQKRLLAKGYSQDVAAEWARIGVIAEDTYWIWIRDAVTFPTGAAGTYDRLLWKTALTGSAGVAILPITKEGKILLNLNYRHATRSWEAELPRGMRKEGESPENAALRELKEETGLESDSCVFLGDMAPDAGTISSVVPIYLVYAGKTGEADREYSEAIEENFSFTKEEIKEGFKSGHILMGDKKIPLRDPFLAFALLQAEIRDLL